MTPRLRITDLSLPLKTGMRGVKIDSSKTLERDGWNASMLRLYSHCGTHMDAQLHFAAGKETIDRIPLARCMGPAWVVRLEEVRPRQILEPEDLGSVACSVGSGHSVLLRTGWNRYADDPSMYRDRLPRIGEGLARWCVEQRVRLLGVEPPSVADVNDREELTRIHKILLSGGVNVVEGLANLEALRESPVWFAAMPLKVQGGDGAPCRAFALEGLPQGWEACTMEP